MKNTFLLSFDINFPFSYFFLLMEKQQIFSDQITLHNITRESKEKIKIFLYFLGQICRKIMNFPGW